jgi:hypothetical protein
MISAICIRILKILWKIVFISYGRWTLAKILKHIRHKTIPILKPYITYTWIGILYTHIFLQYSSCFIFLIVGPIIELKVFLIYFNKKYKLHQS